MATPIGSAHDIHLRDGRTLRAYDTAPGDPDRATVVWHHGSPQSGELLGPLVTAAAALGVRLMSYARPGYGGSTPAPGRDVAAAADDVAQLADALGVERFAVMGASGGGPHALACAALLPERVNAVACLAAIAPPTGDEDWYAGMASPEGLRAAAAGGREARERYAQDAEFDPASFTEADWAALAGEWAALGDDAAHAGQAWPGGLVDDDVAFARPWGFDVAQVRAPVLLVQGGQDRVVPTRHVDLLAAALPAAEAWRRPDDGHVSVLGAYPDAMAWLAARA
ncbi:alpha/beta hydrolase [Cellulomonas cellasea]|uniref:alpha/beta fold hydrolase n=1 Tax=Cellulomonas cellasea TaxID=43670 RepID=UPI0025A40039|nr:alpha/beta hydrolase [Cellulomonas cellasea]MDM8085211.1 alpha/beta hydrolase [Cellulomonas cellasea]